MRSFLLKMLTISFLGVVLIIAGFMVRGVVSDRIDNRNVARQSISDSLAESQILAGPILFIDYTERYTQTVRDDKTKTSRQEAHADHKVLAVMPESLNLTGELVSDPHYRGIFHINAYVLDGKLTSEYRLPQLSALFRDHSDASITVDGIRADMSVSDPRGLRKLEIKIDGTPLQLESGAEELGTGAHAQLPVKLALTGQTVKLETVLQLIGTDSFSMVPLARDTSATLHSKWQHPSFGGRFVPTNWSSDANGFNANWRISDLASNGRQNWEHIAKTRPNNGFTADGGIPPVYEPSSATGVDVFSVSLIDPVDIYSMSDRASKYAELFVALTLGAFLLFELLRRLHLHPMNYLLITAALVVFFLMLLSLSEQIGFGWAYLAAASACVLLIGFYSAHLLRSLRLAAGFTLGLGALYGTLYVILLSEQNALLMGSLLIFILLAGVMLGTRKVDWGALFSRRNPDDQGTPGM